MHSAKKYTILCSLLLALTVAACKKFIAIDPPRTDLVKETVFGNDATATAAMMEVYYQLRLIGFASGSTESISFYASLSADEQLSYRTDVSWKQFLENTLSADENGINNIWTELYANIFKVNAIIEGVTASKQLSPALKKQLEGESKFFRAFCHFYLLNLFGDVPLITTTDYRLNAAAPRTPAADVYKQMVLDLQDAQSLLPKDYAFAGNERVRINYYVATALLARVYLYMGEWAKAEAAATILIDQTATYALKTNPADVFLTNNSEAILQWWSDYRANERSTFRVATDPPSRGALRSGLISSFEANDKRKASWVSAYLTYSYASKYKGIQDGTPVEYSTILRLAEQYLIRAEARAQQNKVGLAQDDVNAIRTRAGLSNTTAGDKPALLLAIEQERKVELFTEWGHRWFDLKRTGRATTVLAPLKSSTWQTTDTLYPVPRYQLLNSSLKQNPGYQ